MRITYLDHSGYVVEYEDTVLIFDYYFGELPVFDQQKKIYVFSSHGHLDHFVEQIFDWEKHYPQITYILSDDIEAAGPEGKTISIGAHQTLHTGEIEIQTLRSTDEGVAFLIHLKDKVIYHAGDLHWWHWEEEGTEYNDAMRDAYQQEIDCMEGLHVDVAFVVLDPRLEDAYYWGLDYYMRHTDTDHVFPMHMWEEYQIYDRLMEEPDSASYRDKVMRVVSSQQSFEF